MPQYEISFKSEKYPFLYINTAKDLEELFPRLMEVEGLIALDTETMARHPYRAFKMAALHPEQSQIRLIQLFTGRTAIVIDCLKCGVEDTAAILRPFLLSKKFIGHNAIFDLQFFLQDPWYLPHMNIGCTLQSSRIIYHARHPKDGAVHSLKALTASLLDFDLPKEVQASNWGVPELTYEQLEYAAFDAVCTYKLAERFAPHIEHLNLWRTYELLKNAQTPIARMQLNGIRLNVDRHHVMMREWANQVWEARKHLMTITGLERITAHTVAAYLEKNLDDLVLSVWPRTEQGKLQTDAHTFADFSFHPIVAPFSRFQKLDKLCSTYGASLIEQRSPADGKLHTNFNLTGARTGRLSSSKPNLQQAPRDREFRANFIPDEGYKFVVADFNQIELRVAAELSQDEMMLQAYEKGIDLHALTASIVGKKALNDVTKEDRQMAKAVNFGFLFGLGAGKFSHYARKSYGVAVSAEEAHEAIQAFRTTYSGYYKWQMDQARRGAETLLTETPCGKKRRLDEGNTYGTAMNHPVQGGAAEVLLHSLVRLEKAVRKNWQLVSTVHDEIIIAVPFEEVKEGKEVLLGSMMEGFKDVFPHGITNNLVEAKAGANWAEAK